MRTANGLGVERVIISGYSPYPLVDPDPRLPHIAARIDHQISKTALGAESATKWSRTQDIYSELAALTSRGYEIIALEQTPLALDLQKYKPPQKAALILGNEVAGIEEDILKIAKTHIQIPMEGSKESLNVSVAGAIAIYYICNLWSGPARLDKHQA